MPADQLDIGHLGIKLIPVLGLGHCLKIHLDFNLGQHGDHGLGNFFVVYIAVVRGNHGALKPVFQPGVFHQGFGLFQIIAGHQCRVVPHITFGTLLTGHRRSTFHDLFDDAFIIDGVDNGLAYANILELCAPFLVQLNGDNPTTGKGHQLGIGILSDSLKILWRHRRDKIHVP